MGCAMASSSQTQKRKALHTLKKLQTRDLFQPLPRGRGLLTNQSALVGEISREKQAPSSGTAGAVSCPSWATHTAAGKFHVADLLREYAGINPETIEKGSPNLSLLSPFTMPDKSQVSRLP